MRCMRVSAYYNSVIFIGARSVSVYLSNLMIGRAMTTMMAAVNGRREMHAAAAATAECRCRCRSRPI